MKIKPAVKAYQELQEAYDFFNKRLFDSELPDLLITLQRGKNTFGYFSPDRFTGESKIAELAMNPNYFGARSLADTLSTLVHEMVHVWQWYTPAKQCRLGYHDRKILKADYNRLVQSESALFEIAKLLRIEAGGIYKRISENREILTQLKELNAVSFEENNIFWLLDAHHQFLLSLAYWMKDEGLESTDDFAVYGQGHEIDNVAVFEIIAKELDTKSFAAEWLQAKRPYTHAVNQTR